MIYRNWSDEFGKQIEAITGIESWYYKECFEYKNKILPQEEKMFVVEDNFILPLVIVKDRYTKKNIPILLGDAGLNQTDLLLNQPEELFTKNNLKIISNARQDLVVNLKNSFSEHKKELQRVGRCYNKCGLFNTIIHNGMYLEEHHRQLVDDYSKYWEAKQEEPLIYEVFHHFVNQVERLSECYTFEVKEGDKTLALAYFEIYNNEVYWHETVRDVTTEYEKYSVGNYVLLKALEELCYTKKLPLNLGVSWFDYKVHWHPTVKNVRGLSYIKE